MKIVITISKIWNQINLLSFPVNHELLYLALYFKDYISLLMHLNRNQNWLSWEQNANMNTVDSVLLENYFPAIPFSNSINVVCSTFFDLFAYSRFIPETDTMILKSKIRKAVFFTIGVRFNKMSTQLMYSWPTLTIYPASLLFQF